MSDSSVLLEFPASSGYLVLARTAIASICARLDYPIDRLEDAKLAIDEACNLLLSDAVADSTIELAMTPHSNGSVHINASTVTRHGRAPKRTSFAWTVLAALVDTVEASAADGRVTLHLVATRGDLGSRASDPSAVRA